MPKAYWVCAYRSITDPDALAAYGQLAGPALQPFGGRMLVRGMPVEVHDGGLAERTVVVEFESVEKAVAAHESPAYRAALRVLGTAAERDFRIVEGVA